jgi:acetylornithine deacetylase/succinyl-diaminopimelate desuccinylase-like protein
VVDQKKRFDPIGSRVNFPQVEEWIRITEIPAPSKQEQERGAYIRAQLEAAGYAVTVDGIGNVIARRPGTGGGETVVYAAHMDTVHPIDTDVTVRRDGDMLRAPGVFDNSASVANMLAIARALNRFDVQTRGDIIFIATVQEELGLLGMEYWLEQNPGVADVLIALDGGLPNVNYGALGIYWTRYFFRGAGSHTNTSAGRPHPGRAMADAIRAIYEIEIPPYAGGAVFNVGMFGGGKIFNAIPEEVWFTMDLRSVNPILLDELDREIERRIAEAAAAHRVEWDREEVTRNRAGGTEEMLRDSEVSERSGLPIFTTGRRSTGWWGAVCLLASIGTMFAVLFYAYFYIRLFSPVWPQDELARPALGLPLLAFALLIASAAAVYWGAMKFRTTQRLPLLAAVPGLALAAGLAVIFAVLQIVSLVGLDFTPQTNAYGSLFYVISGTFLLLLLTALALIVAFIQPALLALLVGFFRLGREHREWEEVTMLQLQVTTLFWYFTVIVGVLVFGVLYLSPYVV